MAIDVDNVFYAGISPSYSMGLLPNLFNSSSSKYLTAVDKRFWGDDVSGKINIGAFFGYGITEYFSMEIEPYYSLYMGSQSQLSSVSQVGAYINGRLFPRKTFRESDFKVVQPFLLLGLGPGVMNWKFKDAAYNTPELSKPTIEYLPDLKTKSSAFVLNLKFSVGVDFFLDEPGVGSNVIGPYLGINTPMPFGLDNKSSHYMFSLAELMIGAQYRYQW